MHLHCRVAKPTFDPGGSLPVGQGGYNPLLSSPLLLRVRCENTLGPSLPVSASTFQARLAVSADSMFLGERVPEMLPWPHIFIMSQACWFCFPTQSHSFTRDLWSTGEEGGLFRALQSTGWGRH